MSIDIKTNNYKGIPTAYRQLIAPTYTLSNKNGQWIKEVKEIAIKGLQMVIYDSIQESNITKDSATFKFLNGELVQVELQFLKI